MSTRQRRAKGQRLRHGKTAHHATASRRAAAVSGTLLATSLTLGVSGPELRSATAALSPTPQFNAFTVKNINQTETGGRASMITKVGGTVFFTAFDVTHGTELWKSDGTTQGTTLVKDIRPGRDGSNPSDLTDVGGTLYFVTDDGSSGEELWKSNGTKAGTVRVKDIRPGASGSNPSDLTNVKGTLFFNAADGATGRELWKSNGTTAGTVRVKDIRGGGAGSNPSDLTNMNGRLFFSADDGAKGRELWKSNGTTAGTVRVKDISAGGGSGISTYASNLTNVNGTLFFTAYTNATGRELWKSNGTAAGTVLVRNIGLDSYSGSPNRLTNVNGTLFFVAKDILRGEELWKSNGTTAGTVLVKDIRRGSSGGSGIGSDSQNLTNVNGTLFFTAYTNATGQELWKSDGTTAGTVLVKDINKDSSSPSNLTNVNGTLFFTADDGSTGPELWKSNGTTAGTVRVKDIRGGGAGSNPSDLTNVNGTLFFAANEGPTGQKMGQQLWKSNGKGAGTVVVSSIAGGDLSGYPRSVTNVNGTLFFAANDGSTGWELWKSDGSAAGTVQVRDINPASGGYGSQPRNLTNVNGTLFFVADDGSTGWELWKSDGTTAGTVRVKDINPGSAGIVGPYDNSQFTNVNGTLFFTADDGSTGRELWKSDGTAAGTVQLKDINPGSADSINWAGASPTDVNGTVFFVADDGTNGRELWKSDGTDAGTVLVKDINPGSGGSNDWGGTLMNVDGTLFFTTNGGELWKSDGTAIGTVLVKDINPGSDGGVASGLTNVNGTVFFVAKDGANGQELWKSDGTDAGTVLVKDINPGSRDSMDHTYPDSLVNVNGILFFAANDGTNGKELWRSDGTDAGTVFVKDVNTGTFCVPAEYGETYCYHGSYPRGLTNVNGTLFFSAHDRDGSTGRELWQSDGTTAGTVQVKDIRSGPASSYPWHLTSVNGTLFFTAGDAVIGTELWEATTGTPPDATSSRVSCSPTTVTTGHPSTCTAKVTDTAASGATTPTGQVSFGAAPAIGAFGSGSCTLVATGATTSSCHVTFTPSAARGYTITAAYGGGPGHSDSYGHDPLTATTH